MAIAYLCNVYWKQLPALIFLISIIFQSFDRAVIVGGYYANAYAKACENKDKPAMKCGGRCQMIKKMQAGAEKNQETSSTYRLTLVLSSKSFFAKLSPVMHESILDYAIYHASILSGYPPEMFHPPGKG